jgi:hypothetical protein
VAFILFKGGLDKVDEPRHGFGVILGNGIRPTVYFVSLDQW